MTKKAFLVIVIFFLLSTNFEMAVFTHCTVRVFPSKDQLL